MAQQIGGIASILSSQLDLAKTTDQEKINWLVMLNVSVAKDIQHLTSQFDSLAKSVEQIEAKYIAENEKTRAELEKERERFLSMNNKINWVALVAVIALICAAIACGLWVASAAGVIG